MKVTTTTDYPGFARSEASERARGSPPLARLRPDFGSEASTDGTDNRGTVIQSDSQTVGFLSVSVVKESARLRSEVSLLRRVASDTCYERSLSSNKKSCVKTRGI